MEKDQVKALSILQRDLRNGRLVFNGNVVQLQHSKTASNSVPPLPSELSDTELSILESFSFAAAVSSVSLPSSSACSTSTAMRSTCSTSESCHFLAAHLGSRFFTNFEYWQ